MPELDASWKSWIQTNIERGSNTNELVNIMLKQGFSLDVIENEVRGQIDLTPFRNKGGMNRAIGSGGMMGGAIGSGGMMGGCNNPNCPGCLAKKRHRGIYRCEKDKQAYYFLDTLILPNAKRIQTSLANVNIIEDFLDEATCKHLISIILKNHYASTITTAETEPDKYFRTSKTCDMQQDDPVVKALEAQMTSYLGIDRVRSETIQGQYYEVGNQFKAHTDWFSRDTDEWETFAAHEGQRTWTFMLYLNDVEEGGETEYTDLGIPMKPKQGMGIIWNNMDAKGKDVQATIHWGKPPIKGEKFVITKWFREYGKEGTNSPFKPRIANLMPVYTHLGYEKRRLPKRLFKTLKAFYNDNQLAMKQEIYDEGLKNFLYTSKGLTNTCPAKILSLDDEIVTHLKSELLGMLEEWSGQALEWSSIYGIRNYQRDAVLKMHTDVYKTHIISFIINVFQEVDEDWPLVFIDHYGREKEIIIKPGEIVLYESARCYHGRPKPFKGDNFANIFGHTRPVGFQSTIDYLDKLVKRDVVRIQ